MALRLATPMDTPALVGIYGQYIHTPITFEYELPSPREFQNRITHTCLLYTSPSPRDCS